VVPVRGAEQPLGLVVVDEAVEHAFGDLAFVGIELAQCLELELEGLIGSALGVPKDQFVEADAEREDDLLDSSRTRSVAWRFRAEASG